MEPPLSARQSIWNGVFDSWADAAACAAIKSGDAPQAFDTSRWLERQSAMLASARSGVSPRHSSLPLFIATSSANSIVDLGGGSGWTFEIVCLNTIKKIAEYVIVEQQTTVDAFASSFKDNDGVRFVASESISRDRINTVDVFYSNSALQYFPDNVFLADLAAMCAPTWILLDDFQTALGGEFFSTQHYYGIEIPCRFSDLQSTVDEMRRLGYTLQGKWEYPAIIGGHLDRSLGNSPDSHRKIGAPLSLLFKKTPTSSGNSQHTSKPENAFNSNFIEVT